MAHKVQRIIYRGFRKVYYPDQWKGEENEPIT